MRITSFASSAVTLTAAALMITACGSSGGAGDNGKTYSTSEIAAKLKSDSEVTGQFASYHLSASVTNTTMTCLATVMQKDVPAGDLAKYMQGQAKIDDLATNTDTDAISKDFKACFSQAIGS